MSTAVSAVTITVQITVPDDVLPVTARRLIDDLRMLTETAVDLSPQYVVVDHREDHGHETGREPQRNGAQRGGDDTRPKLQLGTESRTVWRDDVPVHLSRREYDLLSYLCRNPRRVFSREQLLRNVWGYEMVGGERTVDVHVRRLRAKLGGCADGIVTVRGVGYRFDDQIAVSLTVVEQD